MATTTFVSKPVRRSPTTRIAPHSPSRRAGSSPGRIASNFACLSIAEVACRGTSVAVTLYLTRCLGPSGFGRIEFAFNVVFWLVLLVREGFDVIASREIARHPRLVRPLVNHVLAVRCVLAASLFAILMTIGGLTLSRASDRTILSLYGVMLMTTAMGLDFVFRGLERMGLVALSLIIRTVVYAVGIVLCISGPERVARVPALLITGEICGITLIWTCYARRFGLPRPSLASSRFLRVFLRRGRSVYLIQVSQAVIGSIDLLVVGLLSNWSEVGLYSAPHRMVTAVLTFGLIFQQVVFPSLARSWRDTPEAGRKAMDALVRVLVLTLLPVAVGTSTLASPLVHYLFQADYADAAMLLALGIWRAPLLTMAFLYQTTLIAMNREAAGVRLLLLGALGSGPLVAALRLGFGLPGAVAGLLLIGLALVAAGYGCLARERRQPAWHHHLGKPLAASLLMIPVCLVLQHDHVLIAIAGGAMTYFLALTALDGLRLDDLLTVVGRTRAEATIHPDPLK